MSPFNTNLPSKIICIGRNYMDHITELNNEVPDDIVFFLKPPSSITTTLQSTHQEQLDFETELCFKIQDGRFSSVGVGLDLTKRTLQSKLKEKGLPWERAKAFDGAALFSPFVPIDANNTHFFFDLSINGTITQSSDSRLMIHQPSVILDELSTFMQVQDNDIVMTGTPKGTGPIHKGDQFHARVLDHNQQVLSESTWISE